MKKKILFISLIFTSLLVVGCSSLKNTTTTNKAIAQQVENRNFTISFDYANPARMKQVVLTSEYTLQIKGDSAIVFLPYYGVAYVAPYDPYEQGIKYSGKMKDYQMKPNKKKDGWQISFKTNTNEYHNQYFLDLYNNGKASLTVNSNERDAIDFYGELIK